MTEPISQHGTELAPAPPGPGASPGDGLDPISAYLDANLDRYTAESLRARLLEAGHDPDLVSAALSRRRGTGDVRDNAGRAVFVAYGVTYLVFAVGMWGWHGIGPFAVVIFSLVLGIAFWISRWWVGRRSSGMGFGALVIVPLILLAVVGGACYATTGAPFSESASSPMNNLN